MMTVLTAWTLAEDWAVRVTFVLVDARLISQVLVSSGVALAASTYKYFHLVARRRTKPTSKLTIILRGQPKDGALAEL